MNKKTNQILNKMTTTATKILGISSIVLLTGISNSQAGDLDLVDVPIFLQGSAPPAIALSLDSTPDTRNAYMFSVDGLIQQNGSIPDAKSFMSASQVNRLYYQPDYEYLIPVNHDGIEFNSNDPWPQTEFKKAYINGFDPGKGSVNLSCEYRITKKFNEQAGPNSDYTDAYGDEEIVCNDATNTGKEQNAFYSIWDKNDVDGNAIAFEDATLDDILENANYKRVELTADDPSTAFDDLENFAIWYSYYKSRNMLIKSSATIAFHDLASEGAGVKLSWQSFKQNESFETKMWPLVEDPVVGHPEVGNHKKAFWDWMFNLKPSGSGALIEATNNAGKLFETPQTYYQDGIGDQLSCQQNFHIILANARANGPSKATTLPFTSDDSLKVPAISLPGNLTEGQIFSDTQVDDGFEDYAYHYWANDLMPNLADGVPQYLNETKGIRDAAGALIDIETNGIDYWDVTASNNTVANKIFWNNYNDPADWQHMVNFVISLGMTSLKDIEDPTTYSSLRNDVGGWYGRVKNKDVKTFADQLQHGAVNSRGEYLLVYTPEDLIAAFRELIKRLLSRKSGSSSASTVSGNILTSDTNIFKTSFDIRNWSGSVVAQKIDLDGTFGDIEWDAACNLTGGKCGSLDNAIVSQHKAPADRNIFTYDKTTGNTLKFLTSSLGATSTPALALNKSQLIIDGEATLNELVDYLRGDRTEEIEISNDGLTTTGKFRKRRSVLGDVIHSSAVVIRGPSGGYDEKHAPGYSDFVDDNQNRKNILLVGANDGMLHAIDVDNGNELWAFIPSQSLANMHKLADPDYVHQSFVDASPTITDVKIGTKWRTIAIGGLRLGGQGYYALDITEPLQPTVLWEFTDNPLSKKGNADMGYSFNESFVARIPGSTKTNGKWVAFLPNGYNNTENDGFASTTGNSVLFMVDIATGIELGKFDSGVGILESSDGTTPNGMAGPVASDAVYDLVSEAVFVGDLRGDVYKIDLQNTDGTSSGTIDSTSISQFTKSIVDYKTPITTPLRLTNFNGTPGLKNTMVVIGTGKFIEDGDRTNQDKQYIASIFADHATATYPINILDANVVEQTAKDTDGLRLITNDNNTPVTILKYGWRMELPGTGERIVAKMIKRRSAKFLIYSSYLPNGGSKCSSGGSSVVTVIDWRTGIAPITGSVLKDGVADGIYIENQVFGVTPLGLAGGGGERLILGTDSADNENNEDQSIIIPDFTWRRRSWQRLFPDG